MTINIKKKDKNMFCLINYEEIMMNQEKKQKKIRIFIKIRGKTHSNKFYVKRQKKK